MSRSAHFKMIVNKSLLCVFASLCFVTVYGRGLAGPLQDKIIVCYVHGWSYYRPGAGSFDINDIEPSLCTHLIYCFAGLDENSYKIIDIDPYRDLEINDGKGGIKSLVALKEKHKHLKISIAIGGWNEGSVKYSKMAADPKLRDIFIRSVMNFLQLHKFDGLDLNWEIPTKRGGKVEDRSNFVSLVKELSDAFEPKGYLLTSAIRFDKDDMNVVYDIAQVNIYLDFLHIMSYDYYGAWDGVVNANAPLKCKNEADKYCVEYTIQYLLSLGTTPSKVILGLPMYGRTFIFNTQGFKFAATTTKTTGFSGPFSNAPGFMGYNEICMELSNKTSLWIQKWDEHTNTSYLYDDNRFISYDNPRTIANKVKYATDLGLGGFTAWSIDTDDFRGACDEEPDTYKDYIDRFNKIADRPLLKLAINKLREAGIENEFYVLDDNKVRLRLPKAKFSNYPLLRTVNDSIALAGEEKQVVEEMDRLKKLGNKDLIGVQSPCVKTCSEVCFYGLDDPWN